MCAGPAAAVPGSGVLPAVHGGNGGAQLSDIRARQRAERLPRDPAAGGASARATVLQASAACA